MLPARPLMICQLSLFLVLLFAPIMVRADDDDADEYDVNARVVRLSLISGDVSVRRHDSEEWEKGRSNTPLVEGDTITVDSSDGHLTVST